MELGQLMHTEHGKTVRKNNNKKPDRIATKPLHNSPTVSASQRSRAIPLITLVILSSSEVALVLHLRFQWWHERARRKYGRQHSTISVMSRTSSHSSAVASDPPRVARRDRHREQLQAAQLQRAAQQQARSSAGSSRGTKFSTRVALLYYFFF